VLITLSELPWSNGNVISKKDHYFLSLRDNAHIALKFWHFTSEYVVDMSVSFSQIDCNFYPRNVDLGERDDSSIIDDVCPRHEVSKRINSLDAPNRYRNLKVAFETIGKKLCRATRISTTTGFLPDWRFQVSESHPTSSRKSRTRSYDIRRWRRRRKRSLRCAVCIFCEKRFHNVVLNIEFPST